MASTQTQPKNSKKLSYEDYEYDVEKMPPALKAGAYNFVIDRATVGKTKSNGDDKIDFKFKVESVADDNDDNEDQENKSIYMTHVFYTSNDAPGAGPSKRNLRQLCEATETGIEEVPKRINPETLEEFAALMKGKSLKAWVIHEESNDEVQARIRFVEPSDGGLSLKGDGGEDEKPAKKAPAKKPGRR
jgi:Protein of unknown function (DUF669)